MKKNAFFLGVCLLTAVSMHAQTIEDTTADSTTVSTTVAITPLATISESNISIHVGSFSFGWIYLHDVHYKGYDTPVGDFLDQDLAKSICLNIPLVAYQKSMRGSRNFSHEIGLRLSVNNVVFSKSMALTSDAEDRLWPAYTTEDEKYNKSKLCATYLDLPVRIGLLPNANHECALSVGLIPGVLIQEHTKVKTPKDKTKLHSMNDFRLNAEVRAQLFEDVFAYADYNLLPVFKSEAGPEARALTFGIGLFLNDND